MKLNLRFRDYPDSGRTRDLIRTDLEPLGNQLKISAAHATVERPSEGSPAIRAAVHLEVPGPDISAAASDYTLAAAWSKVMKLVKRQLQLRSRRSGSESRSQNHTLRRRGTPAASRA